MSFLCRKCNIDKPLDQFYKNNQSKTGHCNWCKDCNKMMSKQRYNATRVVYTSEWHDEHAKDVTTYRIPRHSETSDAI